MSAVDNLIDLVNELRGRIKKYKQDLAQNEALTRYVLIDPILRALEWDTEDPERVKPEARTTGGRVDYVLLVNGKPNIAIEAKSLGAKLDEKQTLELGFKYSWQSGIPYFIITDGNSWLIYSVEKLGGQLLFAIDISHEKPEEAVRKLLSLWYPLVACMGVKPIEVLGPGRAEVAQPKLSTPAGTGTPPSGGLDVDKVRKFYKSLNPRQQALLKIAFEAWKNGRVMKGDEIIQEMEKNGIEVKEGGLAGIKSGITRRAKREGLPPPLTGLKLVEEWGRALEIVL